MAGIVAVFDFDKTIVDCDSDNWLIDELGATHSFNLLLSSMPWNSAMDRMMMEFHSEGKTIEDIVQVLKRIPLHPRIVPAIKAAHALGCELRIVSDANMFFIETILEHLGIRECFWEINTNPGFVNEEGRLRILPFHDFHNSPHSCTSTHCPPNMCKGLIIERIQNSIPSEENKRLIYLGDGIGDYCPSLKLKERDFFMPRKNFPVWDLICKDPLAIKAEIHEWIDGEDLERILDKMMHELHSQGKTIEDIVQVLKRTPMHPHIVPAIEAAYSLGCDVKIVSDANMFFIETILKHHGVWDRFSEINANPSCVDEEGRLRIFPFHDYHKSSHGCNLCPPNMCKAIY
ncbi:Inorganic pyrophosphatase 2 [Senna tora]|uniref:Inorganic pyrophosphatase 2 n=1 Tax=Senna tora TaxID=362788 RepID=A0A834W9H6_9FABA|nr:Inorganic pyrophosphatase 2 [Senna tora]